MATLNDADYTHIKRWVKSQPAIKDEFDGWGLSKATWKAALQAVEDYVVSGFGTRPATSIRAAIEAVTGATTPTRAQYVFAAWVAWKLRNLTGG